MKNTIEFLNSFNTELDLSYNYENDITFEEFEERITQSIHETEIVYYSNAIRYLKENDPSLQESLSIASDYGYDCRNLNSEFLATLLYQKELFEEWHNISEQIEEYLNEL